MYRVEYPRCINLREMYVAADGQCMPCCDLSLGQGKATTTQGDLNFGSWELFFKKEWHLGYNDIDSIKADMRSWIGDIQQYKLSPVKKCFKTCNVKWKHKRSYYHLELSTRCTLRCPKCPRTRWSEVSPNNIFKKMDMKYEQVEALVKDKSNKYFLLQGTLGDPVFHPRIFDIIKMISQHKKYFIMSTASPSRTVEWWKEFYSCYDDDHINIVRFGVDGLADTAHMYRKGTEFDKVWEAMKLGAKLGKKIEWQFIPFRFNEHQIKEAEKMAEDNNIQFKLFKSNRWDNDEDPLRPIDEKLYVQQRGY